MLSVDVVGCHTERNKMARQSDKRPSNAERSQSSTEATPTAPSHQRVELAMFEAGSGHS
jgi:hypothetical protein